MKEDIKKNLVILLKLFKDKPQFLINFLLNNNAFTEEFLLNVVESEKLNNFNSSEKENKEYDIFSEIPHFKNIKNMHEYLNSLIKENLNEENEDLIFEKINKDLKDSLIQKLENAIKEEDYLEAARVRDRLKELNINYKKD